MKMNTNDSEITRPQMSRYVISFLGLRTKNKISNYTDEISVYCPFHKETNPSCFIDLNRGIYHCFSCGRGGSVESLYKDVTGDSIYSVLGIKNSPFSSFARKNNQFKFNYGADSEPVKKSVYINYDESKLTPATQNNKCLEYLHKRGISRTVADEAGFKYCEETRINTTLFKNRICIPIYEDGRLMSIEGRRLCDEDEPKVLYPKNTSVDFLYDIDNLNKDYPVYGCEGLMDLFVLRSCKFFKNSTSIFGANITKRQASQIKSLSKFIYVPDRDDAGTRTVEQMKSMGLNNVYVLMLPDSVNGIKIKDIGDLPKAGITPQDLLDRKWLNYIKKV